MKRLIDENRHGESIINKNILGGGIIGREDIFYDLKWTGTGAANQTFSNAQVVDTAAEGAEYGSLTVVDAAAGTVKVVSNKLEITGSGSNNQTGVYHTSGVAKALGKAFFGTLTHDTDAAAIIGFSDAAGILTTDTLGFRLSAADVLNVTTDTDANPTTVVGTVVDETTYKFLCLAGGYSATAPYTAGDTPADFPRGMHYFIRGGTYATWTRVWAAPSDNSGTLYAFAHVNQAQAVNYDDFYIPTNVLDADTMFNPVYYDATPDTDVHNTGISDAFLDVNITTPAAGVETFHIQFRVVKSTQFWNVKIVSGTAGTDLSLHKTDGAEGAAVATADIDWTAATAYDIRVIYEGSTYFRVFVDGVLQLSYDGPDTDFQTGTQIQLVDAGSAFTENSIAVHRRTFSSWDALIRADTGETY